MFWKSYWTSWLCQRNVKTTSSWMATVIDMYWTATIEVGKSRMYVSRKIGVISEPINQNYNSSLWTLQFFVFYWFVFEQFKKKEKIYKESYQKSNNTMNILEKKKMQNILCSVPVPIEFKTSSYHISSTCPVSGISVFLKKVYFIIHVSNEIH